LINNADYLLPLWRQGVYKPGDGVVAHVVFQQPIDEGQKALGVVVREVYGCGGG
jgi:hypothetical protein